MNIQASDTRPWPTELRLKKTGRCLEIDFNDGRKSRLPAEYLRVESPSAEVQGHGAGQKTIVAGKRHVTISGIEPVGHYAVRLLFDDGHATGLFTWDYLYRLSVEHENLWSEYLTALAAKGLDRG